MDFYEKLLLYKAVNRLSWRFLGDPINKEETAMRIAVKRKSLSELEKKGVER